MATETSTLRFVIERKDTGDTLGYLEKLKKAAAGVDAGLDKLKKAVNDTGMEELASDAKTMGDALEDEVVSIKKAVQNLATYKRQLSDMHQNTKRSVEGTAQLAHTTRAYREAINRARETTKWYNEEIEKTEEAFENATDEKKLNNLVTKLEILEEEKASINIKRNVALTKLYGQELKNNRTIMKQSNDILTVYTDKIKMNTQEVRLQRGEIAKNLAIDKAIKTVTNDAAQAEAMYSQRINKTTRDMNLNTDAITKRALAFKLEQLEKSKSLIGETKGRAIANLSSMGASPLVANFGAMASREVVGVNAYAKGMDRLIATERAQANIVREANVASASHAETLRRLKEATDKATSATERKILADELQVAQQKQEGITNTLHTAQMKLKTAQEQNSIIVTKEAGIIANDYKKHIQGLSSAIKNNMQTEASAIAYRRLKKQISESAAVALKKYTLEIQANALAMNTSTSQAAKNALAEKGRALETAKASIITLRDTELMRARNVVLGAWATKMNTAANTMLRLGRVMSRYFTTAVVAATAAGLKMSANIEAQIVRFNILTQTMSGVSDRGKKLFEELIEYSARTPFQLNEIDEAAQTLLAFGTPVEQVMGELKMLGDVAQGDSEKLERVAMSFGKVRSRGTAHMRELNRFIMSGVPIIGQLSKNLGLTGEQLFKAVAANKVAFEDVNQAIKDLTSAGGKFNNMTEQVSVTLQGRFSTALDNLKLDLASVTQDFTDDVKKLLEDFINWSQGFRQLDSEARKALITVGLITATIGPMAIAVARAIQVIRTAVMSFEKWQIVLYAVATAIAAISYVKMKQQMKEAGDVAEDLTEITEKLNGMYQYQEGVIPGLTQRMYELAIQYGAEIELAKELLQVKQLLAKQEAGWEKSEEYAEAAKNFRNFQSYVADLYDFSEMQFTLSPITFDTPPSEEVIQKFSSLIADITEGLPETTSIFEHFLGYDGNGFDTTRLTTGAVNNIAKAMNSIVRDLNKENPISELGRKWQSELYNFSIRTFTVNPITGIVDTVTEETAQAFGRLADEIMQALPETVGLFNKFMDYDLVGIDPAHLTASAVNNISKALSDIVAEIGDQDPLAEISKKWQTDLYEFATSQLVESVTIMGESTLTDEAAKKFADLANSIMEAIPETESVFAKFFNLGFDPAYITSDAIRGATKEIKQIISGMSKEDYLSGLGETWRQQLADEINSFTSGAVLEKYVNVDEDSLRDELYGRLKGVGTGLADVASDIDDGSTTISLAIQRNKNAIVDLQRVLAAYREKLGLSPDDIIKEDQLVADAIDQYWNDIENLISMRVAEIESEATKENIVKKLLGINELASSKEMLNKQLNDIISEIVSFDVSYIIDESGVVTIPDTIMALFEEGGRIASQLAKIAEKEQKIDLFEAYFTGDMDTVRKAKLEQDLKDNYTELAEAITTQGLDYVSLSNMIETGDFSALDEATQQLIESTMNMAAEIKNAAEKEDISIIEAFLGTPTEWDDYITNLNIAAKTEELATLINAAVPEGVTLAEFLNAGEFTEEMDAIIASIKALKSELRSDWKVNLLESFGVEEGSELYNLFSGIADVMRNAVLPAFEEFGASLTDSISGTHSFANAFESLQSALAKALPDLMLTTGLEILGENPASALGWTLVAGSAGVALLGGMANANQASTTTSGTISYSANGDVFNNGYIANSPMMRSTPYGASMIGEAGTEGVLPLTRINGTLGVHATGSGANVQVNIINNGTAQVEQTETTNPDGSKTIDVIIIDAVKKGIASGELDNSLRGNFGVSRRGRR